MTYVYRWEGRDKKLVAAFLRELDADWYVRARRPINEGYWTSPYGPTLPGNQNVNPAGHDPVL